MEEDGGQMEVTCSYDLDLLCNTYLYLISILGDGIWVTRICTFVHLDLWRTNYPNPQITIWAQDLVHQEMLGER